MQCTYTTKRIHKKIKKFCSICLSLKAGTHCTDPTATRLWCDWIDLSHSGWCIVGQILFPTQLPFDSRSLSWPNRAYHTFHIRRGVGGSGIIVEMGCGRCAAYWSDCDMILMYSQWQVLMYSQWQSIVKSGDRTLQKSKMLTEEQERHHYSALYLYATAHWYYSNKTLIRLTGRLPVCPTLSSTASQIFLA